MNWHAHCGIFTYPVRVAVREEDPADHLGRARLHRPRGHVLAQRPRRDDRQVPARARPARLRLARHGRGDRGPDARRTCCGRATRATRSWPRSACAASTSATTSTGRPTPRPTLMKEWGFEPSPEPFERTYRRMSNLDDMHENGIHDYLKFIKFGYGRGTDHSCKDVRAGLMSRDEAIEMVERYDHVKPRTRPRALARVRRHDRGGVRRDRRHLPRPARVGQGRARHLGQGFDPRVRLPPRRRRYDRCARRRSGRTS